MDKNKTQQEQSKNSPTAVNFKKRKNGELGGRPFNKCMEKLEKESKNSPTAVNFKKRKNGELGGRPFNKCMKKLEKESKKKTQANDTKQVNSHVVDGNLPKSLAEAKAPLQEKMKVEVLYEGKTNDNDEPHGPATITYDTGDVEIGTWIHGVRDGDFIIKHPDRSISRLEMKHGKRNGMVTRIYPNGDIYVGEINNNSQPHGRGKYTYKGGWIQRRNIHIYRRRSTYNGEWKDGKENGRGIELYSNGDVFQGGFKNGMRHGLFRLRKSLGSIKVNIRGEYKDGRLTGGVYILYPSGKSYRGKTKKWKPHGKGVMVYANLNVYSGEWKDGKRHGKGTMVCANGAVYSGEWVNGGIPTAQ